MNMLILRPILNAIGVTVQTSSHAITLIMSLVGYLSLDHMKELADYLQKKISAGVDATAKAVDAASPTMEAVASVVAPAAVPMLDAIEKAAESVDAAIPDKVPTPSA